MLEANQAIMECLIKDVNFGGAKHANIWPPKKTKERRILRYFTMKFTTTLITPSDDFIIWSNTEFYQTSGLSRNCWIV